MRAVFGVVAMLIALAIVGFVAGRQLKAMRASVPSTLPASAGAASATLREQSQQLQQQVRSDVVKALEQGAAARKDEAGQ